MTRPASMHMKSVEAQVRIYDRSYPEITLDGYRNHNRMELEFSYESVSVTDQRRAPLQRHVAETAACRWLRRARLGFRYAAFPVSRRAVLASVPNSTTSECI
jgi:hypothetical protein